MSDLRLAAALTIGLGLSADLMSAQAPAASQPPADQAPPNFEETVEVIGATPIHGLGIDREKIPSHIQSVTGEALKATAGTSMGEQLNLAVPGVYVNEATTNPFQQDVQFRGFVSSPLLGLPQGLAVYQSGVRLNEPFGDTVNWDLLPDNAIAGIDLMPGSNPLFGLNALGGAVSVQTKTGFSHPGHAANVTGGSFGRSQVEAESGGNNGRVSYFLGGSVLTEDGWRDFSPSRVGRFFGDVEWRGTSTTLNTGVTFGDNRLTGNGAAPIQLLDEDRAAVFTHPDETNTGMTLVSLRARHSRRANLSIDGMFYYRRAAIETFNGDDSDYDECEDDDFEELLCTEDGDGEPVEDQSGGFIPVDDDDPFDGTNNTSRTVSNGWGGALQATVVSPLASRANHFVTGVTLDGGGSDYEADTEIARLTDDRGTVGTGLFDGDASVRLKTTVQHVGLFAADFFTVAPRLTLMGAARLNHSDMTLRDQVGTDLDGDHSFTRLNPAAGVTYQLPQGATAYASFSVSSRVPAPSELSCADPDDPCRLPNAFLSDPPLKQVVARTWESGIRGRRDGVFWNASVFRTANSDDILFISSGPFTNSGHFQNVGDTLRQGLELAASGTLDALRWGIAYSFLSARFDSALTLSSPNHPDEDDGEIDVEEGDRIPGVPQHNFKANLSMTIGRFALGGSFVAASSQYLRGDEANLLPALDGYAVVNLTASVGLARYVALTARVTNLFDSEYATFGLLGDADDVLGDHYEDPRFLSPAAPLAAWVGLQFSFR